jgi:hypothetical protein
MKRKNNAKSEDIINIDLNNKDQVNDFVKKVNASNNPVKVKIYDGDENFTYGVAVPKNNPNALDYLKDVKDYNNTDLDIYKQLDICRKLYIYEGVVGTAIDILVDLSYSPIKVFNIKNSKAQKIANYFLENVNKGNNNISTGIDSLNRLIAFEYYTTSNVFLLPKWSNVYVSELKNKYKMPSNIYAIDPKIIEIPKETVQFGNKLIYLSLSKVFGQSYYIDPKAKQIETMPLTIRNKIKKNITQILLNDYDIYHIKRRGSMYSGWGIPYLSRAFSSIASKRRLRALDDATIDGMVNSITIFKIGVKEDPNTWKPNRLTAFANLLRNPFATNTLVWGYDIDFIHIAPNGDVLNFTDRYKDANLDILHALGIPIAVLTGQGDKAGDVWASILFLMERLDAYRAEFKSYLEDILEKTMIENGFDNEKPKIRFIKPKINKEDLRNIVLALYDRGLISKETVLEESSYDIESEVNRRKEEKSTSIDKILERPEVPFSPKPGGTTPNPQTLKPMVKKNKDNTKTKLDVNQKTKKPTKRLEGNTQDLIGELLIDICDQSSSIDDFKSKASNTIQSLYNFDDQLFKDNYNLDIDKCNALINKCVENYELSGGDVKQSIQISINEYFNDNSNLKGE